jgi:hypothetical protein
VSQCDLGLATILHPRAENRLNIENLIAFGRDSYRNIVAVFDQSAATALYALIAAALGSWVGAQVALSRFKKERAFDRQLDWYERMIRALHHMALRIDIAVTFKDDPTTTRNLLTEVWEKVQTAHIDLEKFASEAPLFGSQEATKRTAQISDEVQKVADKTEAFDPVNHRLTEQQMDGIVRLTGKLRHATKPLADEARRHLGIR